ncbi:MAG: glycogen-binding domain-containing protein [Candidatus Margulisiibacteriota bacterium]
MATKKPVNKSTAKPAAKAVKKAVVKPAAKTEKKPVKKTVAASKTIKKEVTFTYSNPNGKKITKVSVAGDFNNWDPKKNIMKADNKGKYTAKITLSSGTYAYKFCASNGWVTDPKAECVYDENGNQNSKLTIA